MPFVPPILAAGEFPRLSAHPTVLAIRDLQFLDMQNGPWVAGGAVRRALTGAIPEGDIDVFFSRESDIIACANWLTSVPSLRARRGAQSRHSIDFALGSGVKVQFVTRRTYSSIEELVTDIDYTVCGAVSDGWRWVADERFFEDAPNMTLRVNNDEWRPQHLWRLCKYASFGFHPVPGVLTHVLRLKDEEWLKERVNFNAKFMLTGADY